MSTAWPDAPLQAPLRILVVDDDHDIRALLQRFLEAQGMRVRAVGEAAAALRLVTREPYDLIVLDLSLPDEDGLSVCRRLREMGDTIPILVLTARSDMVDRVLGLEMGADDYLAKPFEPRELVARIKAQVRGRTFANATRPRPDDGHSMVFGALELDLDTSQLHRSGEPVDIKPSEFALLRAFAAHPNRPMGRDKLIALTRQFGTELNARSIDVQVLRLRRLLEEDPANPRLIRTVWGVGYAFTPGRLRA